MLKNSHFWKAWLPPHVGAIIGLYYFHDSAVFISFLLWYIIISGLGVAVGFHRYFSHKAFDTNKFWQHLMLIAGSIACQGNALFWVALHRGLHHRYSDTVKDPHSPVTKGLWTAYQGYAFDPNLVDQVPIRAGADFLRHKDWMYAVNHYYSLLWGFWIVIAILAFVFNLPSILVGLFCAQVWALHQEALVNVVGHVGGLGAYRNFDTHDKSVNRPILGLFTWGQSLHNNHHGCAGDPNFGGRRWYELDPSMIWINLIRNKND